MATRVGTVTVYSDLPHDVKLRCQQIVELNRHLIGQGHEAAVTLRSGDVEVFDPFMDETHRRQVDPVFEYGEVFLQSNFCQPQLGSGITLSTSPQPGPINRCLDPHIYDCLLLRAIEDVCEPHETMSCLALHNLLMALSSNEDLRVKFLDAIDHYCGLNM